MMFSISEVVVRRVSKFLGTNTEGDSCFSINQTGGFCVCRSSFPVHVTNLFFCEAKQAAILEISSGDGIPSIYPFLMYQSECAKSAINLFG